MKCYNITVFSEPECLDNDIVIKDVESLTRFLIERKQLIYENVDKHINIPIKVLLITMTTDLNNSKELIQLYQNSKALRCSIIMICNKLFNLHPIVRESCDLLLDT